MELNEKKSLQFELWQVCNNRCLFCYIGEENRYTPDSLKLQALNDAITILNDEEKMKPYNVVSLIGGEFFQGQLNTLEIKNKFFSLIRKIAELQVSDKIQEVWIMATLTIGNQEDLYTSINLMKEVYNNANKPELLNQVWIVTSYDTIGRFHTEKMHDNWKFNMLNLHNRYPEIKFNTCTILTQDLIQKYLNNEFSFNDFMQTYNTNMFFKQPSPGALASLKEGQSPMDQYREAKQKMEKVLPGFFPKREDFLNFLIKFSQDCPNLYDHLFNVKYRADDLYRNFNYKDKRMLLNHRNKESKNEITRTGLSDFDTQTAECGHLLNYCAYIDSDACMICDREFVRNQY